MKHTVLYLGDAALDRQASYLVGIMSYYNLGFDHVNSDRKFSDNLLSRNYDMVIISDYPASNFTAKQIKVIVNKVKNGTGLLMIGGWESFIGNGGGYGTTFLAEVLPIIMQTEDDRVNFSCPCVITKENNHEIIDGLPFDQNSSVIGGLNAVKVKKGALQLLSAVEYKISMNGRNINFEQNRKYPLLVIGHYYFGRVAAFTSDVAPHWVGPFVDWGNERLKIRTECSETIEVGNLYAQFFANLIQWVCKKNDKKASLIKEIKQCQKETQSSVSRADQHL